MIFFRDKSVKTKKNNNKTPNLRFPQRTKKTPWFYLGGGLHPNLTSFWILI